MATPTQQLFRISPDQTVHTAGGKLDPKRFLSDVRYVTHYAAAIGQCLGVDIIQDAMIEDATSQTAFYYTASQDRRGTVVNGIFTRSAQPPKALFEALDTLIED